MEAPIVQEAEMECMRRTTGLFPPSEQDSHQCMCMPALQVLTSPPGSSSRSALLSLLGQVYAQGGRIVHIIAVSSSSSHIPSPPLTDHEIKRRLCSSYTCPGSPPLTDHQIKRRLCSSYSHMAPADSVSFLPFDQKGARRDVRVSDMANHHFATDAGKELCTQSDGAWFNVMAGGIASDQPASKPRTLERASCLQPLTAGVYGMNTMSTLLITATRHCPLVQREKRQWALQRSGGLL